MRNYIRICLFVLLGIASVSLKAQEQRQAMTPIQFNDHLTRITDTLALRGQRWGIQFQEALKTKKFTNLRPVRQSMERFVDTELAGLRAMKDVSGSRDLRFAVIGLLEFEKSLIERAFVPMEKLSPAITKADMEAVFNQLSRFFAAEAAVIEKVSAAQESYAKANGFQIMPLERP